MGCLLLFGAFFYLVILLLNFMKINNRPENIIKFVLIFPIIIFVLVTSCLLYPVFMVYRSIVSLILKVKLGKKFHGLLYGLDNLAAISNVSSSMIGILLVFEIDRLNTRRDLMECVTQFVNEKVLNSPYLLKLYTTLKSYGGYHYLEYINVNPESFVQKLPLIEGNLDHRALQRLVSDGHRLPFNGSMLWDVLVGTQPLQNDNNNVERYPIMIRVHHLVADGITLTQLLSGVLGDKIEEDIKTSPARHIKNSVSILQRIKDFFNVIVYFPSAMYLIFTKTADSNELHGKPSINNDKIAIQFDKHGNYLRKVKNIRKHTKATIPEIILTAYTESLREHFIKHKQLCPREVTFMVPIVQEKSEFENIRSMNIKDIDLRNKFIALPLQVPFLPSATHDNKNLPLYQKLKLITRLTHEFKTSMECQVSYIMFHILLSVMPTLLLHSISHWIHCTGLVSLLPPVPKKSVYSGKAVATDCIFWIPHLLGLGVTFGSLSYDNRLIFSLNCEGSYMSQEQVEEVLQRTCTNIDLLEKEVV